MTGSGSGLEAWGWVDVAGLEALGGGRIIHRRASQYMGPSEPPGGGDLGSIWSWGWQATGGQWARSVGPRRASGGEFSGGRRGRGRQHKACAASDAADDLHLLRPVAATSDLAAVTGSLSTYVALPRSCSCPVLVLLRVVGPLAAS